MNIALFGGAFDPPHLGHLKVVQNFLKLNLVDEVWLLPVKDHAFVKTMVAPEHRVAMLKLLRREHLVGLSVKLSDFELRQSGVSITFQTLTELTKLHPEHRFSFLIGSDNLGSFHKWHHYREMLAQFQFFVYPRAGFDFTQLRPGMTALTDLEEMQVSSTEVRRRLNAHESVAGLVTPEIIRYIEENHLYSH